MNTTILMELKGIKIAATTGFKFPVTAKPRPTKLYSNENIKAYFIILTLFNESCKNNGIFLNFRASKIPSHAGEKIFTLNGVKISRGHSQYAPFSFTDIKYYNQNINQLDSEGRPKTYGSSAYNQMDFDKKTRVYPPSCKFAPNEEYEMVYLLDSQQWAVFRKSIFSESDIDKMIQYFVTIGTNVKESKSN